MRVLTELPPPADERLHYGGHASQFVDFRRPAAGAEGVLHRFGEPMKPGAGRPLAITIHGGFWRARYDLVHAGHLCAALAGAGYLSANVEYRRVGEPGGGWPGTFDDVKGAVEFARALAPRFGGDPSGAVVLGHSAGGHLALWVAAEIRDLAGAIGLAPVASLHQSLSHNAVAELMGGSPAELPERYALADPARPTPVPRVLIHGDADDTVPIALSRGYPAPAERVEIPGAGHFALIDPLDASFGVVLSVLARLSVSSARPQSTARP